MKKIIAHIIGTGVIFLYAAGAHANQFCFASAKTYYEQVYCELEAKGKARGLPSFEQFKRNNEVVQASLLKLPAERNRIALPPPKRLEVTLLQRSAMEKKEAEIKPVPVETNTVKPGLIKQNTLKQDAVKTDSVKRKFVTSPSGSATADCQLHIDEIQCSEKHYRLIGNKTNAHLAEGALLEDNKMALPLFQQGEELNAYVTSAYRQYIEKMCAIGLGGVTMTYTRFAYLYEDLQSKNVNFVQRFELMYTYLKKDKASMWVSEKIPVNAQLAMQYCELISEHRYICATQGQNYIFELE